jgi:hypothetical protein
VECGNFPVLGNQLQEQVNDLRRNLNHNPLARSHYPGFGDLTVNSVRIHGNLALKSTAHKYSFLDYGGKNIVATMQGSVANDNVLGAKHHGHGRSDRQRAR